MKNGTFIGAIIQMQFIPRWSEFAPRFEDTASSHSFRCGVLALLVGIAEERIFGQPIDRQQLLGRALWGDLNNTGTGSIKHVTKKEHLLSEHIRTVEHEVSKEIVTYLSRSLQSAASDYIVNARDATRVGRLVDAIDTFDALLFCYREAQQQPGSYFAGKFAELHAAMQETPFASIRWLLDEFDKREGLYEFLLHMIHLDTVKRWNGSYNLVPDNDATHSFRVASLALFNGLLEKLKFGHADLDLYRLTGKALLHDLPEALCGDVVTNFKNTNPSIKKAFEAYEKSTAQSMIAKLPEPLHADLTDLMVECKSDDDEGRLVDIADKLDALIKANMEMRNNPRYVETFHQQLIKVQISYENPCVIFFLAYILHDLTYTHSIR